MKPCLKQKTECLILRADGRRYYATNECAVDGLEVCPRVSAGCETGTGYELCGSTHAEANAAAQAAHSADVPGQAFLKGHTWLCKPCQDALRAVNVNTFHIVDRVDRLKGLGNAVVPQIPEIIGRAIMTVSDTSQLHNTQGK